MNKIFSFFFMLFIILYLGSNAQNLLSPVWDISSNLQGKSSTKRVNLMLSWERQGFSWMTGNCTLSNDFIINDVNSRYVLTFALQCNINTININGVRIGGDIACSFWTKGFNTTTLDVPASCLKTGTKNNISIEVSNLSYTGGKSYNVCVLSKIGDNARNDVSLAFSETNHQLSVNEKKIPLLTNIVSAEKGTLNLIIRNDYSDTVAFESQQIDKGEIQLNFDLKKYNLPPGLYECIVILDNGTFTGNVAWLTLSPELIACNNPAPDDFDLYWDQAMAELKSIPPDFRMHKVDSLCSLTRNGYVAEMQSIGGIIIRAYYFAPKGKGKYPAILHLPGYSYGFTYHDDFKNRKEEVVELALCVRGHGISADIFNPWKEMTLWAYKVCDKEENVYRSIYLDCVRAVEFLLSCNEVDPKRIGVTGGSQGGGLTIATAALCNTSIKACAFFDPFPCDTRHLISIRKMGQDELSGFSKLYSGCTYEKVLEVQDYVDAKNLAPRIKCPVMFTTALFDDDCPPHVGFAAYNRIQSEKVFKIYSNDSHRAESGEYREMFQYMLKQLYVGKY